MTKIEKFTMCEMCDVSEDDDFLVIDDCNMQGLDENIEINDISVACKETFSFKKASTIIEQLIEQNRTFYDMITNNTSLLEKYQQQKMIVTSIPREDSYTMSMDFIDAQKSFQDKKLEDCCKEIEKLKKYSDFADLLKSSPDELVSKLMVINENLSKEKAFLIEENMKLEKEQSEFQIWKLLNNSQDTTEGLPTKKSKFELLINIGALEIQLKEKEELCENLKKQLNITSVSENLQENVSTESHGPEFKCNETLKDVQSPLVEINSKEDVSNFNDQWRQRYDQLVLDFDNLNSEIKSTKLEKENLQLQINGLLCDLQEAREKVSTSNYPHQQSANEKKSAQPTEEVKKVNEVVTLHRQISELKTEKEKIRKDYVKIESDNVELKSALSNLKANNLELMKLEPVISCLQEENAKLKNDLETERTEYQLQHDATRQKIVSLEKLLEEGKESLRQSKSICDKQNADMTQLSKDMEQLMNDYTNALEEQDKTQSKLNTAVKEIESLEQMSKLFEMQSVTFKEDFKAERSLREEAVGRIEQLKKENNDFKEENIYLHDQLKNMQNRSNSIVNFKSRHADISSLRPMTPTRGTPNVQQQPQQSGASRGEKCPRCHLSFPDINSWQNHFMDCLDDPRYNPN